MNKLALEEIIVQAYCMYCKNVLNNNIDIDNSYHPSCFNLTKEFNDYIKNHDRTQSVLIQDKSLIKEITNMNDKNINEFFLYFNRLYRQKLIKETIEYCKVNLDTEYSNMSGLVKEIVDNMKKCDLLIKLGSFDVLAAKIKLSQKKEEFYIIYSIETFNGDDPMNDMKDVLDSLDSKEKWIDPFYEEEPEDDVDFKSDTDDIYSFQWSVKTTALINLEELKQFVDKAYISYEDVSTMGALTAIGHLGATSWRYDDHYKFSHHNAYISPLGISSVSEKIMHDRMSEIDNT